LDTKNCDCSADEIAKMEAALGGLADLVRDFPTSDLYITIIYHSASNDYHVKTSLVLPNKTLFTGDRDYVVYPAYERCVHKLRNKVQGYKQKLANVPEYTKHTEGTRQEVQPTSIPDGAALERAIEAGDYAAFRRALDAYEDPLRQRVGRWVQRYPDIDAEIDSRFTIADIVDEIFLNAFEEFDRRPNGVALSDWLENLIDPSIKYMMRHPEELDNISQARSYLQSEDGGA
jgi:hypothetical protein